MHFYTHRRVPPFGLYVKKILDVKFFGNFKKKSQKWPTQDLSNIERNKVMKNQPIWGIPRRLAYNNQPGGLFDPPPCRIRSGTHFLKGSTRTPKCISAYYKTGN